MRFVRTLLMGIGLGALACGPAPAQERLRVCLGDVANPPFRVADANGRLLHKGLDFLFLDLLAERTGVAMQPAFLPARRCLLELKAGQQDAVFSVSHLPEREEAGLFPLRDGQPDLSLALRVHRYVWYVRADSGLQWDGKVLTGLPPRARVGAQTGYSIAGWLRERGFEVDDALRALHPNIEKLLRGRVAALALQASEADGVLRRNPEWAEALRRLDPPLQERPYFVMLGRHLAAQSRWTPVQWWAAIAAVRDSPAYRQAEAEALSAP